MENKVDENTLFVRGVFHTPSTESHSFDFSAPAPSTITEQMHWIVEALEKARVDGSAFLTPLVDEARKKKEAERLSSSKKQKGAQSSQSAMEDDNNAKASSSGAAAASSHSVPSKRERDVNSSDPDGDVSMDDKSGTSASASGACSSAPVQGTSQKKAKISS